MEKIKLITSETKVHGDCARVSHLLTREVEFEISLKILDTGSAIMFNASNDEIERLRIEFGARLKVHANGRWVTPI